MDNNIHQTSLSEVDREFLLKALDKSQSKLKELTNKNTELKYEKEQRDEQLKEVFYENYTHDPVNRPKHYTEGKYECIDVMGEVFGKVAIMDFCVCNAFKYLYRCNKKHKSPVEDVKKANWYLNKYIELGAK